MENLQPLKKAARQVYLSPVKGAKGGIFRSLQLDGPPQYQEIQARSILNEVKAMMPMRWTINPYRGCRHACVYCYARPTHNFYNLDAGADFHTRIFVKINAPQLLRKELQHKRWKKEAICLGSATDPYQPAENRFHLSRQLLEVLVDFANPLDIITKSNLVVRDIDLLAELNRRTGNRGRVAVNISLSTINEEKARLVDPGAPSVKKRLEALAQLSAAGIKTRLFIMPVLPGITDIQEELEELVKAGAEAGATMVAADSLRIARGLETYYYSFIEQKFPELLPRYERIFSRGRRTMAPDRYRDNLRGKMGELRKKYNLVDREEKFDPETEEALESYQSSSDLPSYRQKSMFEEPLALQEALEEAETNVFGASGVVDPL